MRRWVVYTCVMLLLPSLMLAAPIQRQHRAVLQLAGGGGGGGPSGFPQIVGTIATRDNTSDSTSQVANLPAGIQAGELLLCWFAIDNATSCSDSSWTSAGWTELSDNNDTQGVTCCAGTRTATGSEGSTLTIMTVATEQSTAICMRITDQHASTAPEVAEDDGAGVDGDPDSPSLNPSGWDVEDTLWLTLVGVDGGRPLSSYPAEYTDNRTYVDATNAAGASAGMATLELNAASDDPSAWNVQDDDWCAATIAIRPN